MSWEDQARCLQYDPELFFTPRGKAERRAKQVCANCPVTAECLAYALETRVEFGVWGGTTGNERRMLLRHPSVSVFREPAPAIA
jgi:WhiB family transcriptional regulator, redox-sensing transcriptional regulator